MELIRAIDRTAFWEGVLASDDKWLRAKWARKTRKFIGKREVAVYGTAFIFPETPEPDLEEFVTWLEYGFELTQAKIATPQEARELGQEYAWSVSKSGVALIKCDEEGNPIKRTSKVTLDDFVKFVEEEVWKRKSLLRDAALAFLEIGDTLLGWSRWGIKALKCSLLGT
jgi:hypothetical protein